MNERRGWYVVPMLLYDYFDDQLQQQINKIIRTAPGIGTRSKGCTGIG